MIHLDLVLVFEAPFFKNGRWTLEKLAVCGIVVSQWKHRCWRPMEEWAPSTHWAIGREHFRFSYAAESTHLGATLPTLRSYDRTCGSQKKNDPKKDCLKLITARKWEKKLWANVKKKIRLAFSFRRDRTAHEVLLPPEPDVSWPSCFLQPFSSHELPVWPPWCPSFLLGPPIDMLILGTRHSQPLNGIVQFAYMWGKYE